MMTLCVRFPNETALAEQYIPRAPRYGLSGLTAIADLGDRFWAGRVLDLSATGCLVWSEDALLLGQAITLIPSHHHDARLPLEIHAKVVRVSAGSPAGIKMALRFRGLSVAEREGLHSFAAGHGSRRH